MRPWSVAGFCAGCSVGMVSQSSHPAAAAASPAVSAAIEAASDKNRVLELGRSMRAVSLTSATGIKAAGRSERIACSGWPKNTGCRGRSMGAGINTCSAKGLVKGMREPHLDRAVSLPHEQRRLAEGGWASHHMAIVDAEARRMPRARHHVAVELPFFERPAGM